MPFLFFAAVALIGAAIHRHRDTQPRSAARTLEIFLVWWMVVAVGVAAINGPCAGLGFVMAMMCDLRFAAPGTKLTTAFARRGLVAEYGLSWVLPRVIGPARAMDLLLSGRTLLAEEASHLGVVDRLTDLDQALAEATEYARELATYSSPASMATIKRQVYDDLEQPLAAATADAYTYMDESFERSDFAEGVASFVERREPRFPPLGDEVGAARS